MAKTKRPTIPDTYKKRLAKFRREMRKAKVTAALITRRSDYRYLAGFTGEDSAILVRSSGVLVISDGRFDQAINEECPWVSRTMRKGTLDNEIAEVCKREKLKSMAVQANDVTIAARDLWQKKTKSTRIKALPPILMEMRRVKDANELRSTRKAVRVAQEAFLEMRKHIRIGDTELQMAARLEFEMKKRGSLGTAFPSIVAEGPNSALPHAHPGNRKVKKGSAILFDWGAKIDGYCSDLTRIVFVGSIPRKIGEIYEIVLAAQLKAIKAVKGGAPLDVVDKAARGHIKDKGYAKEFNHGLGHGLGLDVHEGPRISWQSSEPLWEGEVVTIEPGIYIPGTGGVRIEDDVLVTKTGRRVLSTLSKDREDSVIKAGRR